MIGLQLLDGPPVGVKQPAMTRFELSVASATDKRIEECVMSDMSDLKQAARDTKTDVKEAWRRADGEESLGDKVANTTDRAKDAVENAGDELHEEADEASRDAAYNQGRADEISRSR